MTLVWIFFTFLSFGGPAQAGTSNDKSCIKWMLDQYPDVKKTATYLPEHDLLIEKLPTPNGPVSLIHTQKGSVASVPHASAMDCQPKRGVFGGREIKGISGFLNLAMATKISGMYFEDESTLDAFNFLRNMPTACDKTSYPIFSKNINAVCKDVAKTRGASFLVGAAIKICKRKTK